MSNNGVEGTIVLLDTDVGLLETLASFFRLHGFAAEPFYNTRQILLADAPIGPGCLLMEWELGESNGLQVLGKLRQIGWTFPCVFYTGCSDISSAVQAIREGAANFITKPCPEERLLGV